MQIRDNHPCAFCHYCYPSRRFSAPELRPKQLIVIAVIVANIVTVNSGLPFASATDAGPPRTSLTSSRWERDMDDRANRMNAGIVEFEQSVITFPGDGSGKPNGQYSQHIKLGWNGSKLLSITTNIQRPHVRHICAFDGQVNQTLTEGGVLYDGTSKRPSFPMGIIRDAAYSLDTDMTEFQPVLLSIQPFHPQLGRIVRSKVRERSRGPVLDGREIVAINTNGMASSLGQELWLDPERRHAIVRIATTNNNGGTLSQSDLDCRRTPDGDFLPDRWTILTFDKSGLLRRQVSATIQRWDFEDTLDDDAFRIDFPEGTVVTDVRTDEDYLVKPGNVKRVILSNEMNAPYEQWLVSESGEAHLSSSAFTFGFGVAIICSALLVLVCGGFLLRRWRR